MEIIESFNEGINMLKISKKYKAFQIINYSIVSFLALICFLPLLNVFAISLSDRTAIASGSVGFWPVNFTLASYEYVLQDVGFLRSGIVSVYRVILGGAINLVLTLLCAYPLSKSYTQFKSRTIYIWLFLFATLFNGGLIPTFMVVKNTGIYNTIWALVIPCALPIFHIILVMNFFRGLPKEIEEASLIDGATHWKTLWMVYVPLSKASIATVTLFSLVNHWNSWFDGMIYTSDDLKQPLATFLHTKVVKSGIDMLINITDIETLERLMKISDQSTKSAQIFLGMIPILFVYPFLQKYFTKGIILGSVKG